jgi:hypothetical protein
MFRGFFSLRGLVRAGQRVDDALGIVFDRVDTAQHTIFFKDKRGRSCRGNIKPVRQ